MVTSDANPIKEAVRILGVEATWRKYALYDVYKKLMAYEAIPTVDLLSYKHAKARCSPYVTLFVRYINQIRSRGGNSAIPVGHRRPV